MNEEFIEDQMAQAQYEAEMQAMADAEEAAKAAEAEAARAEADQVDLAIDDWKLNRKH